MNTFCGVGRLTADPQTRKAGDHEVTSFRLALDRARSDGADFITVEACDRLGEVCQAYLATGREVAVTGRLRHDEFTVDGNRRHDWLGHADPAFTLRTYVHLLDDGVGDATFMDSRVGVGNRWATGDPQTAAMSEGTESAEMAS